MAFFYLEKEFSYFKCSAFDLFVNNIEKRGFEGNLLVNLRSKDTSVGKEVDGRTFSVNGFNICAFGN